MFSYSNGKIFVVAPTRCGHTSMFSYFQVENKVQNRYMTEYFDGFQRENVEKVLVIRNPYDRLKSAINYMNTQTAEDRRYIEREFGLEGKRANEFWLVAHSMPFMKHVIKYDFKIIKFENLASYIDISQKTVVTNSKCNSEEYEDLYIKNFSYTEEDLKKEHTIYKDLISNRETISVTDWKNLTS